MGGKATRRQVADITLFSTASGLLATNSMQHADALHLLLLSQRHRHPALTPLPPTFSWLPLTHPGRWALLANAFWS